MPNWSRAPVDTLCGCCGREILPGEPVVLLEVAGATTPTLRKIRCAKFECAGEPVPNDLPPLRKRMPAPALLPVRIGPEMLPLDYKARGAGEREPGEDDV